MSQLPELECACCFTDVRADELAQCNEGHLYCKECLEQLASHAIGSNDYAAMHCVDQSGCKADFCIQQRQQFLDRTKMQALDKLEALASVLKASSTDLKNCSFCGEARIVDGGETVFDCPNLDCRKKTCLSCEKEAHTGKSCEDAANNDQSAAQHRVADQMTEALVRTCPGCKTLCQGRWMQPHHMSFL
ncbi:hypothetical protein BCR37DRAFT_21010 [Protomyces lactucae-debilis]|uniref:RING-type domain-containing protein n=1 Tax=Protomyces lactucae-debilis TaxID=2754530 RepID=A0A1Y2FEM3_PROLT|nr:uncharacterized protein BCR37DRAFT_21010 [Protomyces lactucae-debilis]ORY81864.1 hypothetical protein BCR37DRAFT_21010 [Protomyces lactucae-debilis]